MSGRTQAAEPASPPRGLPERLPDGERLVWQGAPDWQLLTRRAFHVRGLAAYFGVIVALCAALSIHGGASIAETAMSTLRLALFALVPIALAVLYAWMVSRATVYTITSRRVVLHIGLALPVTINMPFRMIDAAGLNARADGSGDICLLLNPADRLAYLVLWPHARPWRFARTEPMLRALPDAARVGQFLARALAASAGAPVQPSPETDAAVDAAGSRQRAAAQQGFAA